MACGLSPSLCTAAANGDVQTVEKHLKADCCNPFAAQYFVDPDAQSHPGPIMGLVKRKKQVMAAPRNSDTSGSARPATPAQVALYYQRDQVLFLLLNHYLKVAHGNVAKCYDETAEAIATLHGYTSLMEFFQYYDQLTRPNETIATCWTEAMRHICDLTGKMVKLRKQLTEGLEERTELVKQRDDARNEGERSMKEATVSFQNTIDQKNTLIVRLQNSAREQEAELMQMRSRFNSITGEVDIRNVQSFSWEPRLPHLPLSAPPRVIGATIDPADSIELVQLTEAERAQRRGEGGDLLVSRVSACIQQHVVALKKAEALSGYSKESAQRSREYRETTHEGIEKIDNDCSWNSPVGAMGGGVLESQCNLELKRPDLQLFDNGPVSAAKVVEKMLVEMKSNLGYCDERIATVLQSQTRKLQEVAESLVAAGIANDPSISVLQGAMRKVQEVSCRPTLDALLDEVEGRQAQLTSAIEASNQERRRWEETQTVSKVDMEYVKEIGLRRQLLDLLHEKLSIADRKADDLNSVSAVGLSCEQSEREIGEISAQRDAMVAKCISDVALVEKELTRRHPGSEVLQEVGVSDSVRFEEFIADNDREQENVWVEVGSLLESLVKLQETRCQKVRERIVQIMNLKRKESEDEVFRLCANERIEQLRELERKCKSSAKLCTVSVGALSETRGTMVQWQRGTQQAVEDKLRLLHEEFFTEFREWFLRHGEYTYKKRTLYQDVECRIREKRKEKAGAVQRLDSGAELISEEVRKYELQKMELENLLPRLEAAPQEALPMLNSTMEYLRSHNLPFTHPNEELEQKQREWDANSQASRVARLQEELKREQALIAPSSAGRLPIEEAAKTVVMPTPSPQGSPTRPLPTTYTPAQIPATPSPADQASALQTQKRTERLRFIKELFAENCVIIPKEFLDPITDNIFLDPVKASDGNTYERASITKFIAKKKVSPLTKEPMTDTGFEPHTELKDRVERWVKEAYEELAEESGQTEGGGGVGSDELCSPEALDPSSVVDSPVDEGESPQHGGADHPPSMSQSDILNSSVDE